MLDHIGIRVSDYARAKKFYDAALAPLGIALVMEVPQAKAAGYGSDKRAYFWISEGEVKAPMHAAFVAESRTVVDAFHAAALAAGGTDNGAPGPRAHYSPTYYGAFVRDSDGHNIEAVCRKS